MKRQVMTILCSILFLTICLASTANAEPVTQTITIKPGWNAIFLQVEPVWKDAATEATFPENQPTDSQVVFNDLGTDLISAWMWNPQDGTVEFIQNPDTPVPEEPDMLAYVPGNALATNLYAIHGNHGYLINYAGATDFIWDVTGEPLPPAIDWKPNSYNFVGFHLDPAHLPLYEDFFASSPAHAGQTIYILDAAGNWSSVGPSESMDHAGEAFWIYCNGSSEFSGPVTVQLGQGHDLGYGAVLEQQEITIKNDSAFARTVSLSLADGISASPVGTVPSPFPLFYWEFDPANDIARWTQMPTGTTHDITIEAGASQVLKLGVKRTDMTADTVYTTNLQVDDGKDPRAETLFKVPVLVTGISYAGLWVGDATISKVNQPAKIVDPGVATSTGSQFSYRLIVHVDSSGQTSLLNQVIQMWDEQNSKFVLFADDALIAYFSGASLRDGQPVGRRISSPAFGNFYDVDNTTLVKFKELTPADTFATMGGTIGTSLFLPKEDPSNPFVHKFHPDHPAAAGFDITRAVSLEFSDNDSDGNTILGSTALGWGSTEIGGIYRETMSGLLRSDRPINIEGIFVLHRVSNIGTLTTTAP